MRYIIRTLRFEDGALVPPDEGGWANWRVVDVLTHDDTSNFPDGPRVEQVRCLIEDRT